MAAAGVGLGGDGDARSVGGPHREARGSDDDGGGPDNDGGGGGGGGRSDLDRSRDDGSAGVDGGGGSGPYTRDGCDEEFEGKRA